jgi:hypothetical protein
MIYIDKDSTNTIVLTLDESSKLINPYYLFSFENEYNLDSNLIWWTTSDVSSYVNRYNQFNLIESATGSTTGGINTPLKLISGQYIYRVYESLTQTLNINDTTGVILEKGRMIVSNILMDGDISNDSIYS